MISINPFEIMWKYITLQWDEVPKGWALVKEILMYPFKALLCLSLLGALIAQHFGLGLLFYILTFPYYLLAVIGKTFKKVFDK